MEKCSCNSLLSKFCDRPLIRSRLAAFRAIRTVMVNAHKMALSTDVTSCGLSREQDRQCAYQRNIEARSCDHCCSKSIIITYSECLLVALGIEHALRKCRIVICGLSGCTIFFPHYLINSTILEKRH